MVLQRSSVGAWLNEPDLESGTKRPDTGSNPVSTTIGR